jgi:hypothetical protein
MFASFLVVAIAVIGRGASVYANIIRGSSNWDPQDLLSKLYFPEVSGESQSFDLQHDSTLELSARRLNSPLMVQVKSSDWANVPAASYSHPDTRSSHSAAVWHHDGTASMVVSFGYHSPSRGVTDPQSDVWAFNFGTSLWSRISSGGGSTMDHHRGGHLSVVHDDKLYVYGGLTFDPTISPSGRWFNSEQDGKSNIWMMPLADPHNNPTWSKVQSDSDILTRGEVAGGIWGDKVRPEGGG